MTPRHKIELSGPEEFVHHNVPHEDIFGSRSTAQPRALLRVVERGEEIHIRRCQTPVARLVPIEPNDYASESVDWDDLPGLRREIWGKRGAHGTSVDSILDDLRSER